MSAYVLDVMAVIGAILVVPLLIALLRDSGTRLLLLVVFGAFCISAFVLKVVILLRAP